MTRAAKLEAERNPLRWTRKARGFYVAEASRFWTIRRMVGGWWHVFPNTAEGIGAEYATLHDAKDHAESWEQETR